MQYWWPAETPFEVITGAILVQNTAWTNAAKALHTLRTAGVLSLEGIRAHPVARTGNTYPPFRILPPESGPTETLRRVDPTSVTTDRSKLMLQQPAIVLREELLALKGIGRETADTILLYAAQRRSS